MPDGAVSAFLVSSEDQKYEELLSGMLIRLVS